MRESKNFAVLFLQIIKNDYLCVTINVLLIMRVDLVAHRELETRIFNTK